MQLRIFLLPRKLHDESATQMSNTEKASENYKVVVNMRGGAKTAFSRKTLGVSFSRSRGLWTSATL